MCKLFALLQFVCLLSGKVRELNRQLECRDEQVSELTASHEIVKLEAERHSALVTALRQRVADYETRHSGLEGAASHAEQQLRTLQAENREAKRHILQLEARIRLLKLPVILVLVFHIHLHSAVLGVLLLSVFDCVFVCLPVCRNTTSATDFHPLIQESLANANVKRATAVHV